MNKGIGKAYRKGLERTRARPRRYPCRCTACGQRRTLSKHPDEYVRPPRCASGCRVTDATGRRVHAPLRVDWYRMAKEWHSKATCYWCGGYSFPHARGRGFCAYNPHLTAEQLRERAEEGRWA